HAATRSYMHKEMVIDASKKRADLLPVGIAHLVQNKRFHRTFERPDFNHLRFDTQFIQRALQKGGLRSKAPKVYRPFRIDVNPISRRSQVVSTLGIALAVGNDEFTGLFEIEQCIADFL